jgi:hypothetical protein
MFDVRIGKTVNYGIGKRFGFIHTDVRTNDTGSNLSYHKFFDECADKIFPH